MIARQFGIDTLVRANAVLHARRPAVVDGTLRLTWAELDARADLLANHLLERGIGPGDRVALLLVDGAAFLELLIACARIGAVAVLLNWRLAPAEIGWIMRDSSPALVFHSPRYEPLLADASGVESFAVVEPYSTASAYHALATRHSELRNRPAPDPARALYMMYTSGTTGRPKGCLQSDAGTAVAGMAFAIRHGFTRDERLLSTNPLFHVAGMHQAMAMLACGGCCVFPARDDNPHAIRELSLQERCTTGSAMPPIILPWREHDPLPDWRTYTTGSGMGRPRFWEWLAEGWGTRVIGGYGQTEIGGFATFIDYPDMLEAPHAIGWPMAHVAMTILDPDGNELPDHAEGEIAMRGPSVMLGYWNNPDATEAALGHGWLRSGDLGMRDAAGRFTLFGRAKELIKTGGENVYPAEVDAVFMAMPEVADAGCCGVADKQWGEAVKAFVVLKPGESLDRATIAERFRSQIAGYKRPRYIEFVDALPRDPIGKLLRRDLAARPVTPDQAA
jgi:acyl-CoA synthetase (AMP-forming)/AMP-acid ligase II